MLSTAVDVQPEIELVVQGGVVPFIGKPVRITVYDQGLALHGAFKKEFSSALGRFQGSNPDQVVPEKFRFPSGLIGNGSDGILLTIVVPVIDEVPGNSIASKWAFGAPTERTEANPGKLAVAIDLMMCDINLERQIRGVIRIPYTRLESKHRIIIIVENPADHKILYSNAWTDQGKGTKFHEKNGQGGPTIVNTAAVDAGLEAKVGSNGVGVGQPISHGSAPAAADITGIYEAFMSAKDLPARAFPVLTVELTQAGNAVAGWIAPLRQATTLAHLQIPVPPSLLPYKNDTFGVLLGHFEEAVEFKWGHAAITDDPAFELVQEGTGTITIESADFLKITFVKGQDERTLFLRRIEPVARWSNATFEKSLAHNAKGSALVKRIFRGQQVQPPPLRMFELMINDFDPGGKLGSLIIEQQTTTGPVRLAARTKIDTYLKALGSDDATLESVVAHFIRLSASSILEITVPDKASPLPPGIAPTGKVKKSVYQWLLLIVKEQLDPLIPPIGNLTPDQAIGRVDSGFQLFGLSPVGGSIYRIEFFPLGGETPTTVKVGAYGFEATVKRFALNADNSVGAQDTSTGFPLLGKKMFGGFLDIGVGIELKFSRQGIGAAGSNGGGGPIMSADFPTFHELAPADFASATFYSVSAAGPSIGIGIMDASVGSSAVMVLTVRKKGFDGGPKEDVRLVAGIDEGPGVSASSKIIKKPDVTPGENPIKPSFSLGSISIGGGYMSETAPAPIPPPQKNDPPANPDPNDVQRIINIFFRRGSPSIEGRALDGYEESLAIERALFTSGGAFVTALGHCSPEGPDNLGLSQRRADSAIAAIKKAFGDKVRMTDNAFGKGDTLAIQSNFPKPGNPGKDPQVVKDYQKLEATVYPLFRFVEIKVDGKVSFVLKSRKVSATD
jgi:hypothetical protein